MHDIKRRPLGVTIIAILTVIGGFIYFISGLALLLIGIGIILFALAIAYFIMGYGLWKGRGWARTITLLLSAIGIIIGIASIATAGNTSALISITIHAVVIYYLYRPNVKAFFGK